MIKSCLKCILPCLTRLDLVLNLLILSGGQNVLSCQLRTVTRTKQVYGQVSITCPQPGQLNWFWFWSLESITWPKYDLTYVPRISHLITPIMTKAVGDRDTSCQFCITSMMDSNPLDRFGINDLLQHKLSCTPYFSSSIEPKRLVGLYITMIRWPLWSVSTVHCYQTHMGPYI
jgi:hypothetical protein